MKDKRWPVQSRHAIVLYALVHMCTYVGTYTYVYAKKLSFHQKNMLRKMQENLYFERRPTNAQFTCTQHIPIRTEHKTIEIWWMNTENSHLHMSVNIALGPRAWPEDSSFAPVDQLIQELFRRRLVAKTSEIKQWCSWRTRKGHFRELFSGLWLRMTFCWQICGSCKVSELICGITAVNARGGLCSYWHWLGTAI